VSSSGNSGRSHQSGCGGLRKLGVPVWIAERESQWGDHYQFIATKSSLGRAVSKQVLSKKGLVSCLDYYLERHDLKFN